MKYIEYKDKTVMCRELNSGNYFSAKFKYTDNGLLAEIYTWEKSHHFEDGQILLEDTHSNFISLHGCIVSGSTSFTRKVKSHKNIVDADFAVVGDSPWNSNERFSRVNFRINEALILFTNGPTEAEFIKKYRNGDYKSTFLTLELEICRVSFSFEHSMNLVIDSDPVITGLNCEIEFIEPLELTEFYESIWCITSFFSLCLGQTISPKDINISRTDFKSWDAYLSRNPHENPQMSSHQILWLKSNNHKIGKIKGLLLYQINKETDIELFASALERWITLLSTDWRPASKHMCKTLSLNRNSFDAERVLCAFRWLESIPTFNVLQVETDSVIKELTETTIQKAKELNIQQEPNRIKQMLSKLKEESFKQQVDRILLELSKEFSILNSMKSISTHINNARVVRGKAAHNILEWSVTQKTDPFTSVIALEALCTFLMLNELPYSERNQQHIEGYVLVKEVYRELK